MIDHPLIFNFYLRNKGNLIKELASASDATLQGMLAIPDQYTTGTLVLADSLICGKASENWTFKQFDWLTAAGRQWKTSAQRKMLLEGLLKRPPTGESRPPTDVKDKIEDALNEDYAVKSITSNKHYQ
jgi:hypothetical protein